MRGYDKTYPIWKVASAVECLQWLQPPFASRGSLLQASYSSCLLKPETTKEPQAPLFQNNWYLTPIILSIGHHEICNKAFILALTCTSTSSLMTDFFFACRTFQSNDFT
jgi:hypothetical protein